MTNPAHGRGQLFWGAGEAAYGTEPGSASVDAFVAADALQVKIADANAEPTEIIPEEKDNSRSTFEIVEGPTGASWNLDAYLKGSGTGTTPPDIDIFLEAALGAGAINGSDYDYSLASDITNSLAMLLATRQTLNHSKLVRGAICETMNIKSAGGDLAVVSFGGPAANVIDTMRLTVASAVGSADVSILVTNAASVQSGSILTVGVGSSQWRVTDVNTTTNTITVTPGWGASTADTAIASSGILFPWFPTSQTLTAQKAIAGVTGSITVGAVSQQIRGFDFGLTNGFELHNDEYGVKVNQGYSPIGRREIKLTIDTRAHREFLNIINNGGKYFLNSAILITIGTVLGNKFEISLPAAKLKMPPIPYGEREIVTLSAEYMALVNSTSDDEMVFSHKGS